MGGLLGVSLQSRRWIVSVCSSSLGEIGFLCAGWYNGRNWLATGWVVRGWDEGEMEGPTLEGAKGVPQLSLEVRRAGGRGGRRQEAMDATNCIGAASTRSICVREVE